jgi:outer membrane protein TolC
MYFHHKIQLCVALFISATTWLPAQKVYSLEECRTMALENNVKVRNAANSTEAAKQTKKEAFTHFFPTVSATGMGFNANKGLLQTDMGPGMQMSMLKDGILGGITLTQPVFAGGQIINGNKLASVGVEVSKLQENQSEDEVRLTVEQYYWQVVTLQEKRKTLLAIEKQLQRIEKDVQVSVDAGVTTRNNLLQVQLRENDIESSRINLENGLSLSRMVLAQYIGAKEETIEVETTIPMESTPTFPNDLYVDPTTSLPTTKSYQLLEQNVKANKLQKKIEVGKNLPTVGVGAGYMYDDLMDKSHPFTIGFVSVSVPLSAWWGGSHAIKKQQLQVVNAENQMTDGSELLIIGMQKAWNDLEDAYKQILVARKSIDQSTENLRLNEDYYKAGTTTMSDLLDAQTLYQQSRDKYVDSYAQFKIKATEYLQATGR